MPRVWEKAGQTKAMHAAATASLIITIVGGACLWNTTYGLQAFTAESARRIDVVHEKKIIPNVVLETMTGAELEIPSDKHTHNSKKITIVEFIYTSCPTICQTAAADLASVVARLKSENLDSRVQVLSVSFDPLRDGINQLASYGDAHGADGDTWTIARPSQRDLAKMLDVFGVVVIADEFGGFEHNAALHVVDMRGRLTAILDTDDIDSAVRAARQALQ